MNGAEDFQKAYRENEARARVRVSRIGAMICITTLLIGASLDFLLHPELAIEFLLLRLATVTLMGGIFALHFTDAGKRAIAWLIFGWLILPQILGAYMIYRTGGHASPYYPLLNLAVLAMGVLLPFSIREVVRFFLLTLALYLVAVFAHPAPIDGAVLYNNLYYMALTATIAGTALFMSGMRRRKEYQLAHEVDQRNRKLAEMDRMKSEFFANVSHELRTPLTLILAPLQDLLQSGKLPQDAADTLALVRGNAQRLLRLVNDLLDVLRLEEGKGRLERSPLRLHPLVRGIVDAMMSLAQAREVRLLKEMDEDDPIVVADTQAVEKILLNLVSNALKFTPPGGSITVRTHRVGERIQIAVQDTGVGISEQDLPHVFERFRQGEVAGARRHQGTGLGLALVKELAEQHGGRAWAVSRPGHGATICVELPLIPAAEEARARELLAAQGDAEPAAVEHHAGLGGVPGKSALEPIGDAVPGRAVVLVVDDEPDMRGYLIETLKSDFRLLQAGDGRIGLELARRLKPDLVLLDYMLPELDGLDLCRELKSDPETRHIKVVILTARVDEQAKLAALATGADDFLTKPFSSIELKTRLKNLQATAQLEQAVTERNSELERALNELRLIQAKLVQSEKLNALGSLAAGLLHEVNNPLNYSLTALSLLQREPALDTVPAAREMLADIDQGMQRIRRIVSDLRAFAHPTDTDRRPFALADAVQSAIQFTAESHRGIVVENRIDPDLRVSGSRAHIVQVLINLVSNAAAAVRAADREGRIRLSAERLDERVRVRLWDNGTGMDPQTLNRAFDPFFTTREVGDGMGLGLSVCHTIIANHGGQLSARSEPGQWTELSFDLPLATEAVTEAAP